MKTRVPSAAALPRGAPPSRCCHRISPLPHPGSRVDGPMRRHTRDCRSRTAISAAPPSARRPGLFAVAQLQAPPSARRRAPRTTCRHRSPGRTVVAPMSFCHTRAPSAARNASTLPPDSAISQPSRAQQRGGDGHSRFPDDRSVCGAERDDRVCARGEEQTGVRRQRVRDLDFLAPSLACRRRGRTPQSVPCEERDRRRRSSLTGAALATGGAPTSTTIAAPAADSSARSAASDATRTKASTTPTRIARLQDMVV